MTKIKAVAYCRVSTDNQKDEGTVGLQVDAITEYCKANSIELIDTFSDEGVSGGLEDRPALADLFDFIETTDEVKAVIIYKLDRLARDLIIQENLIKDFEKKGLKLISTKEQDLDSKEPTRVFIRQVLGGVAQYEKGLITMRLSGGRARKARSGGYAGGRVALGYESKDKDLITNAEADTVRVIFAMKRYKRLSINEIARRLNTEGYKTKRGGKWYASTIKYILDNQLYKGNYQYTDISRDRQDLALLIAQPIQ